MLSLVGGRVIDPKSGLDAVRNVRISGDRIHAVTDQPISEAQEQLDVRGMVVAPGFIDLHSHAQSVAEHRLQALDGVTTVLDLEAGRSPIEDGYRLAATEGRPLNYGFSASWALTRMAVVADVPIDGRIGTFLHHIGTEEWQRPATPRQLATIIDRLSADLDAGALGVGMLVGYAQGVDPQEYVDVAALAASLAVPTFTHARDLVEDTPDVRIDGAEEVVRTATETGAHMHYCHINSTSRRHIDRVGAQIEQAKTGGARVSTEAYPYGSGMTGIGAAFLAPDRLANLGITPQSIVYAPTGERIADNARLAELRHADPAGLAIIDFLDETNSNDLSHLFDAMLLADTMIASDAMPITWRHQVPEPTRWPLPPDAVTHPRTAGTYAKSFRILVRETEMMSVTELVRRASTLPAQLLADSAPDMGLKGSIEAGSDADLVVFDPATLSDQATYAASTRPSTGIQHVIVNGTFLVRDGEIVTDALPGRPIRGSQPSPSINPATSL